jgi:hypothetical protein
MKTFSWIFCFDLFSMTYLLLTALITDIYLRLYQFAS